MLTHRGFSAWIAAGDRVLPEYLVAVDSEEHRVSCWIPGEEGKTFSVCWRDHGGKVDTCSFITLDGLVVPGRFLFGEGVTWRSGVRTSLMTEKPFMFTKVPNYTTDVATEVNKDAGTIVLRIKRVNRVAGRPANLIQQEPEFSVLGKRKVGDLCIGFGEHRQAHMQYSSTWAVVPHDKDTPSAVKPNTYVSFVFRYRSPEFLEAQGIAAEEKKSAVALPRGEKRRVASLPPPSSGALATPSPSPPKRLRLMDPPNDPSNFCIRRPSAELRRTVSWKAPTSRVDTNPTQGVLVLSRNLMSELPTPSTGRSESSTSSDHVEGEE